MKHTKGIAKIDLISKEGEDFKASIIVNVGQEYHAGELKDKNIIVVDKIYNKANAELIADAFNTTSESGLTPSELLKQNKELLEALKSTKQLNLHLNKSGTIGYMVYSKVEQAINNTSK